MVLAVASTWLGWCPSAFALNPALDVSQYAHTAWKVRDGFTKGSINAIAQTPDGYLWLGTEFGLIRFDGVRTVPWQPPANQQLPSPHVRELLVSRDGALWIGTREGLARWNGDTLTRYAELNGYNVASLVENRDGSVWVAAASVVVGAGSTLCAIHTNTIRCYGKQDGIETHIAGLYADRQGRLWVGTLQGLWQWTPGSPTFHALPPELNGLRGFAEDADGALLIGMGGGIRRFVNGRTEPYPLPEIRRTFQTRKLRRDRDGSLWLTTPELGLVHVHQGRADVFAAAGASSDTEAIAVFEDREGTMWVSTVDGLDRFRDVAAPTFTARQGLSGQVYSVLGTADGSVWLATAGGLNRWTSGRFASVQTSGRATIYGTRPHSLFLGSRGRVWVTTGSGVGYIAGDRFVPIAAAPEGNVNAIAEDAEGVWFASITHGAQRIYRVSERDRVEPIPLVAPGGEDVVLTMAGDRGRDGLWIGFLRRGIAYVANRQVRSSYSVIGRVNALQLDRYGTVWAATESGLIRLKDGREATLTTKQGLPCDAVHWAIDDDEGSIWLKLSCGLVRISRSDFDGWTRAIDSRAATTPPISATVFDNADGVRLQRETGGFGPVVTRASDGRLWFKTPDGVSIVDPRRLPFNSLPPPVHIEQVIADRKPYDVAAGTVRLPALIRDLQIDYTALSLAAPEKNQFRIKLEGRDRDWQDVGTRRQAFYNDLPPRHYRFRVMASNNNGVWNESGAALELTIAPAYYQTTWFAASSVAAMLVMIAALFQLRLRYVAHQFNLRLDERVNERTRIARELHDTLLQSFHGLLFRFQAVHNRLPESDVRRQLEAAIAQAGQAITEGRDAVQNLRLSTSVTNDLAEAIGTLGKELSAAAADHANGSPAMIQVGIEGASRELHAVVRDDVYRIAAEAMRNAFRHAHARRIDVSITYGDAELQLRIRDDGAGIDPAVLAEQPTGHFGLPGMRERAQLIGGQLELWSRAGVGTQVNLTIPAAAAYATPRARGVWPFATRTGTGS
jgi:signal transduction histidine kinase/ligand-binding sensor domain-containing protein